jgi:hypothetical protein
VIDNARNQLGSAFDAAIAYRTRLDALSSARWSTPEQVREALAQRLVTTGYINEISTAILKCFDRLRPDPRHPESFLSKAVKDCQDTATKIEKKRHQILRMPEVLQKTPHERVILQAWHQLNGMTGPTRRSIKSRSARRTVGRPEPAPYARSTTGSACLITSCPRAPWRGGGSPGRSSYWAYPVESHKPVPLGAPWGAATTTLFERGALVTSARGTARMSREMYDRWQQAMREGVIHGRPCGDEREVPAVFKVRGPFRVVFFELGSMTRHAPTGQWHAFPWPQGCQ